MFDRDRPHSDPEAPTRRGRIEPGRENTPPEPRAGQKAALSPVTGAELRPVRSFGWRLVVAVAAGGLLIGAVTTLFLYPLARTRLAVPAELLPSQTLRPASPLSRVYSVRVGPYRERGVVQALHRRLRALGL